MLQLKSNFFLNDCKKMVWYEMYVIKMYHYCMKHF